MLKDLLRRTAKVGLAVAKRAAKEARSRVNRRSGAESQSTETSSEHKPSIKEDLISATDTNGLLDSDSPPALLDCREKYEWEAGHIEGTLHIPVDDLSERVGELDKSRRLIVYCLHGIHSAEVWQWLTQKEGFTDVQVLDGGIVSWYAECGQNRIRVMRDEEMKY
jgi:rhodanese-related sulfurtransferase